MDILLAVMKICVVHVFNVDINFSAHVVYQFFKCDITVTEGLSYVFHLFPRMCVNVVKQTLSLIVIY